MSRPRLYNELADWWHLLSSPTEYVEEASIFREVLLSRSSGPCRRVLELGCGGGNNASHLKADFELTLTDLSEDMLRQSRRINPECRHVAGDMRSLRLGTIFDAVFVHDALTYLTERGDLGSVAATAHAHLRPGGLVLFVPDWTRETFRDETGSGGHDAEDGRGLRYLVWHHDPDPSDDRGVMEFAYLLREPGRPGRVVHDVHDVGLFPHAVWHQALADAGFDVSEAPFVHSSFAEPRTLFLGHRR